MKSDLHHNHEVQTNNRMNKDHEELLKLSVLR